jgi:hypothetical protein
MNTCTWIIVKEVVHIARRAKITTTDVDAERAVVTMATTVHNESINTQTVSVATEIRNANGGAVASETTLSPPCRASAQWCGSGSTSMRPRCGTSTAPSSIARRHRGSRSIRTYSGSVGKTVLIMNSLNLSFSSVFGRCAERSNQTSCFRGAFNASKYFAESTEGTS